MIQTLEWTEAGVRFIDQRKLPMEEVYVTCRTYEEVADAISTMVVRGAPAIGVAGAMGIALGIKAAAANAKTANDLRTELKKICDTIGATRPTAVNLRSHRLIPSNTKQHTEQWKRPLAKHRFLSAKAARYR